MIESRALTGDDLAIDDVWAIAVDGGARRTGGRGARADGAPRARSSSAPRTAASEHTYGVNTGFGRFVSKSIPEELTESCSSACCAAMRAGRRALPGRDRPRGDAPAGQCAREGPLGRAAETVELLLECLDRGVLPRVPSRGSVGASGDLAPLAHLALPLSARARPCSTASGSRAARHSRGPASSRHARGEGGPLARQRHAVHGRVRRAGSSRRGGWRRLPTSPCAISLEALQGSRTSFIPQIHALRPLRGPARLGRERAPLLEGSAINESHRWCDKVQDAYSLRCAPQVHGASRDLLDYVRARSPSS